ncbi:MAG: 6-pyruvoyl-tetrahydropterin synthase-related protein [Erysipelotrichaceae bacterium]|nr:6-pyruvoyl-tetrahydropterin synthase-related protein [Erysipelotrichaceae bacterium]
MAKKKSLWNILSSFAYVLLSLALIAVLMNSGTYPDGENTMYHLYRAELLLNNLKNGQFFVYYDPTLYNGTEILRYFGVLPSYFMALVRYFAGGVGNTYLIYTALIYFVSATIIYHLSIKLRPNSYLSSFILGAIWFYLPTNLFIWFRNGDLSGATGLLIFVPLIYYYVKKYIEKADHKSLMSIALYMAILTLCEESYAMMTLFVKALYLLLLAITGEGKKHCMYAFLSSLLGIGLVAFYFIPAFTGNINYFEQSEGLKINYQSIFVSLNPLKRIFEDGRHMYFGLSLVFIALLQFLFGRKENRANSLCFLICLFLSSYIFYEVMSYLSLSGILKMIYVFAISAALLYVDLLSWFSLRKSVLALIIALLIMDIVPSFSMVSGNYSGISETKRFREIEEYVYIDKAKELGQNRIALLDNGMLSSLGTYLVSEDGNEAIMGTGWNASMTKRNTRMLYESLENGNYLYLFDRLLSYGADMVIVKADQIGGGDIEERQKLKEAAERLGYIRIARSDDYHLYRYPVDGKYGVVSTYRYLAIGRDAENICETFPAFELADSDNLSYYTYEDLIKYEVIYLAGFDYDDRSEAEELVKRLSENGVNIIIEADGIPEDKITRNQAFLNLECQPIKFRFGYPDMETVLGSINPQLFPEEYEEWETVYVNGLDEVYGIVKADETELPFIGKTLNDNIYVVGFRLTQFYGLTGDEGVGELLSLVTKVSGDELPEREIVKIDVQKRFNGLTINTDKEGVKIPYAYAPSLKIKENYTTHNSLLLMKEKTMTITYHLTAVQYLSWAVSLMSLVLLLYMRKIVKTGIKKEEDE